MNEGADHRSSVVLSGGRKMKTTDWDGVCVYVCVCVCVCVFG